MSFIKKLIGSLLSIVCAIGCSANDEQERKELIKWLDHHIAQLSQQIESDIDNEKKGFYLHPGKTEYTSRGYIEYELAEKTDKRMEISERSLLTLDDIKSTDGYKQVALLSDKLNIQLDIKEFNVDGDEVEDSGELDEYVDDEERYFVIRISGWLPELDPR
ncbi:MAG: hypothetical protein COA54_12420 [Thiotrichaceae bacterium]|nr:MAG: hypothetical protein COA54_12420 [Thiotrichaceae bacterium]